MNKETDRVPNTATPPGVAYDVPAPGSTAGFTVWMCNGPAGYRTVVYIQKTLNTGQVFTAFDFIDDGQTAVDFVGNNVFCARHGTKPNPDWPDVTYLYAVTPGGTLAIGLPDLECARGHRVDEYLGGDQLRIWKPEDPKAWARRYCWNGNVWTQGADTGPNAGCDPTNVVPLIPPRPRPGKSTWLER